ncbi:hypothetical protein R2362_02980 [Mycobacteroides chelonae]|nr:hypothetical protein [Mycobacteroides chelonae]
MPDKDAIQLIAEVLKPLIYADMRYPDELFAQRRAEAYAAEVDKALGGLTRKGNRQYYMGIPGINPYEIPEKTRFVSGWTVTE